MKSRKLAVLLLMMMFLVSCGNNTQTSAGSETSAVSSQDANTEEIYKDIMDAEHLDVAAAYEQIRDVSTNDGEINNLIENLSSLIQCQGHFIQEAESGRTYTADISFYLSKGSIYANVAYTNYGGELQDGLVKGNVQNGYLYESDTTGQFHSRTQDFKMYFGPEEFYVSWSEGTCTYTLTRGDGSAENATAAESSFEESHLYEVLDESMAKSFDHYNIRYNEDEDCVQIEIEAPGENGALRDSLDAGAEQVVESWSNFIPSIEHLGSAVHPVITAGDGPQHSRLYVVDRLHDDGVYSKDEYLILIQDGTVEYEYEPSTSHTASGNATPSGSNTSTATTGERNALSKAKDYLRYAAFSYSGLIEQLEYEGFTNSEAVYGADNCGADWDEQAVLKAAEYLDFTSFSRQGLIEQLEFEGFTHEQAVYGAEQNGF